MRLDTVDRTGRFINRKVLSGPLIFLSVFALAAIPRLVYLDYFLMVDENLWYERSAHFLQGLVSGNLAQTVQTGHPGVTTMWSGTVGLLLYYLQTGFPNESLLHFADRMVATPATLATLSLLRLPLALLSALSVAAALVLGRRLLGWGAALGGAALMAFEPLFLAHSRVLHHDSPAADFSLLAVLAWLLYLKEGRRRYQVLAGIGVALAILSKVSCVFLLGFAGLTLLPALWGHRRHIWQAVKGAATRWLGLAGVTCLVIVLAWPAVWAAPLAVGNTVVTFISSESGPHANGSFFLGQPVLDPGPLYYPVSLAFELTPLTWAGLLLALLGLGLGLGLAWARADGPRLRGDDGAAGQEEAGAGTAEGWQSGYRWAAWLLLYAILFVAYLSVIGKKQERYVLPAVVAFDLLAGWGYYHALGLVSRATGRWMESRPGLALQIGLLPTMLLAGQCAFAWPVAPYYSTFYNPLLGGGRVAEKTLLIGRGEGLDQAIRYIQSQSPGRVPQVASWYGTTVTILAEGRMNIKDVVHPNFIVGSDYVIFYINQLQRERKEALLAYVQREPPIYTVRLNDIDYAYIYRGQAVDHPVDSFDPRNRLVGKASLAGFKMEQTPAAGAQVPLRLYWVNEGMGPDEHFYVRLADGLEQDWGWGGCESDPSFGAPETWLAGDLIESECQLMVYPGTPPGDYVLRAGVINQAGTVIGQINLSPEEGTLAVASPSEFPADEWVPAAHAVGRSLTDEVELIGYDYEPSPAKPGATIPLTLYWRALQPAQAYTVRLTLEGDGPGRYARWEGIPVNGRYATANWSAGEVVRDPWQLNLPASLPGGSYKLSVTLVDRDGRQADPFVLETLDIQGREHAFVLDRPPATKQEARLGESIRLLGYDLLRAGERLQPGGELSVALTWQAEATPSRDYTVFVQLLDAANQVYAQHDGQPGEGALATTTWAPGEYVHDEHVLRLPDDLPGGEYHIIVGMYLLESGERLPVFDADGQPLADYVRLNRILQVRQRDPSLRSDDVLAPVCCLSEHVILTDEGGKDLDSG